VITGPSAGKAAALLALHTGPGFVLPNAWDAGSARILEQAGFPAIATTSAGIAWSCGVPDAGTLDRDTMLEHVARIVAAVGVPVTADLEAGYGDTAGDVGRTVAQAVELGAVGANLEDAVNGGLFGTGEAADRMRSASRAEDRPQDRDGEGRDVPGPRRRGSHALDRQVHVQLGLWKLTVIWPLALSAKWVTSCPTTLEPSGAKTRTVRVKVALEFFSLTLKFPHAVACPV
jgi:hypothetical protein